MVLPADSCELLPVCAAGGGLLARHWASTRHLLSFLGSRGLNNPYGFFLLGVLQGGIAREKCCHAVLTAKRWQLCFLARCRACQTLAFYPKGEAARGVSGPVFPGTAALSDNSGPNRVTPRTRPKPRAFIPVRLQEATGMLASQPPSPKGHGFFPIKGLWEKKGIACQLLKPAELIC